MNIKRFLSMVLALILAFSCISVIPMTVSAATAGNYMAKLDYSDGSGTYLQTEMNFEVGTYQLDLDYKLEGAATKPYAKIAKGSSQDNSQRTVITEEDGHYTATFNVTVADTYMLALAEYYITGVIYYANPVLKKVVDGQVTGENLVWDFAKQYEEVGATVTTEYGGNGKWYKNQNQANFTILPDLEGWFTAAAEAKERKEAIYIGGSNSDDKKVTNVVYPISITDAGADGTLADWCPAPETPNETPITEPDYILKLDYTAVSSWTMLQVSASVESGARYQFEADYITTNGLSIYAGVVYGGSINTAERTYDNGHITMPINTTGDSLCIKVCDQSGGEKSGVIYFANPVLKKVVDGELTGENLIWDFKTQCSQIGTMVTNLSINPGQWHKSNASEISVVTVEPDYNGLFGTPVTNDLYIAKLDYTATGSWTMLQVKASVESGARYQFEADYITTHGLEIYAGVVYGGSINAAERTYDNGHITMPINTNGDSLCIKVCDQSGGANSGVIYFANPVLKKVVYGKLTGENLIYDFSEQLSAVGATIARTSDTAKKWYKNNNSTAATITIQPDVDGLFAEGTTPVNNNIYFKLTLKAKMLNGSHPYVGFLHRNGDTLSAGAETQPNWVTNTEGTTASEMEHSSYSYNAETGEYTWIFGIEEWITDWGNPWGYITIGNVESNGGLQSEADFNSSFIMTDPVLNLYNPETGETGEVNLIKDFSDANVNMDSAYIHSANGETYKKDALVFAPVEKWSVEGTPSLVEKIVVPADFFTRANATFTKHEATNTTREYYTSDRYQGVYFEKLGNTYKIITNVDKKMVVLTANKEGGQRFAAIGIPIQSHQYFNNSENRRTDAHYVYYKVTADIKVLSGNGVPMLSRLHTTDGTNYELTHHVNGVWNTTGVTNEPGLIQCSYDSATGKFVGWARAYTGYDGYASPNGADTVLLIGNAEAPGNNDQSYETSFAITDVKVDLYDGGYDKVLGRLVAEDIAPDLYEETIVDDISYIVNDEYPNRSIARASTRQWSSCGDAYMVNAYSITDCFLDGHNVTYNAETTNTIAHYNCATCGKNYADQFGSEELKDVSATQKMIMVKASGGYTSNAFIPLDFLTENGESQYFVFKCKMKLIGGEELPSISVMRALYHGTQGAYSEYEQSGYGETGSDVWSSYDEETMTYTAVIKMDIYGSQATSHRYRAPETFAHHAILLGNSKHVGNGTTDISKFTTFAFTEPELYKISDKDDITSIVSEDLCTNITDKSLNFNDDAYVFNNIDSNAQCTSANNIMAAPANKWSIDGYSKFVTAYDVPENFFSAEETDTDAKMLRISGVTNKKNEIAVLNESVLEPGATYQFDLDYRNYGGSAIVYYVQTITNDASEYTTIPEADRTYTDANAEGSHLSFKFTVPEDAKLSSTSSGNFRILLGRKSDATYAGDAYFANVQVRKVTENGLGENVIYDGDFSHAKETVIKSTNINDNLLGWNADTLDDFTQVKTMAIPEDFFVGDAKEVKDMAIKYAGGDWGRLSFKVSLEANTTYRLTYNYRAIGRMPSVGVEGTGIKLTKTSAHSDDEYIQTCEIVTDENCQPKDNVVSPNARIQFYAGANGLDQELYISNVRLYKVVDGKTVGTNIIGDYNPIYSADMYEGIEEGITLALKEDDVVAAKNDLGHGWYANKGTATLVKVPENFYTYKSYADRLTMLRRALLKVDEYDVNDLYFDPNLDDEFNIKDLIATKENAAIVEGEGGAQLEANELLAKIESAENTATTGTVYYVSNSGKDSNAGTEAEPFATIAKANTKAKSGDTILFERGGEWRVSSSSDDGFATVAGVTYGSYGTGAKPLFIGSAKNYTGASNWENVSGNVWKTEITRDAHTDNGTGVIYLLDSKTGGEDIIGRVAADGAIFTKIEDLKQEGDIYSQEIEEGYLWNKDDVLYAYVYCEGNPGEKYGRIEIPEKRTVITLANGVTLDNIAVKYAGGHAINGSGLSNVTISNCEIGYVGGAKLSGTPFGNGIQFGLGGSNLTVVNNYVYECCDAGITFQSWGVEDSSDNTVFDGIHFIDNLLTNNYYNIEFFTTGTSEYKVGSTNAGNGTMKNIEISGNIMRYAGECWSYTQRLSSEGNYRCANICVSNNAYYINTENLNIVNNIFDCTKGSMIYWTWKNVTADVDKTAHVGLNIEGNSFYQKSGATDSRVAMFGDTNSFDTASSLYGLKKAVEKMDKDPLIVSWIDPIY